jgi:hypothetical protein
MPVFQKTSATNTVLDVSEFEGGSGILDENSTTTQKAFKDINERLELANEDYDGLMSSADKKIINNIESTIKKYNLIYG